MERNPFAPPTADVSDVSIAVKAEPPYFAVSLLKLSVLSVCTLGIYEIYWFYRHWRSVKLRENNDILPFARAFFAVLFCYALFKEIRESEVELGLERSLAPGPLAAGWIIFTLSWRLPEPYWLATFLAVVFLLPVQLHANRINTAVMPVHDENARFTAWNWAAIVLGGALLALSVVGIMFPPDQIQ